MTIVLGFPITAPITCAYARLERLVPPAGLGAALHADGYTYCGGRKPKRFESYHGRLPAG
jgi:hypothetical protein